MTNTATEASSNAALAAPQREDVAQMLIDRLGDQHLGLRTRTQDWSWDEVVRESAARGSLAKSLRAPGPFHIGVLLENDPEFLFWLGGAALTGATIVGINPTRRGAELEAEVRYVDCQLIVTDKAGYEKLSGLDLGLTEDRFVLVDDASYPDKIATHHVESPQIDLGVDASTLFLLLFTSGTTGMSKAVRCSQGRLTRLAYANCAKYDIDRDDVCYCCMPLFHGNALMALWAPALSQGATVCLVRKFTASGFMPDVRFYGATYFTYVGKALGYLMATAEQPDDIENTLTHGFGTEASPGDKAEFIRRFGAQLFEGYGSSEGAGSVVLDPNQPAGALGRPANENIVIVDPDTREERPRAILDEHGHVLNPDESIGEMVDKAGSKKFEGYYKNEDAIAEKIRHGWYWTGDLGYVDEAGFIYFAGRKGDWIRVDGENTSALMIEHILRRHPKVIATGVFAVPDPRSGDQVMAAIEVADLADFDPVEFADYLAAQADLGTKAAPRFVRVSTDLPVTGSNKVLKRELQADRWRTDEPVFHWVGRGTPEYTLMTETDVVNLEKEFETHGRSRFL
ncbi:MULTISPECIES: AMP-binding protein [Rhodococcus]|jgi:fatty-acyl-CoA synthase|uniref:AMP-binding protein n=2 Tax=Nocardiaceae TaxID=85025 RepID=UPI000F5B154B|nr:MULTISPECIES: AMP-binding protein [Rhodococcus]NHP12163.1 AMP-binding protein [Rhodococcus sp. IC4_135]MBJ7476276.1 AMP-binding protein [Rhodococcus sp. (in: high G+C Gram-positive bacteria)]QQM23942.1 AMP-binding protein [Rhodococcus sp. P-2]RQO42208.1 acyl-CoA synthetase [Rhodococcus sp. KBW08]UJC80566.1 acyl-CoA synthetase [Rhodococcus erythropolis]